MLEKGVAVLEVGDVEYLLQVRQRPLWKRIQAAEPGTGRLMRLLMKAMDVWPLWVVDACLDEMERKIVERDAVQTRTVRRYSGRREPPWYGPRQDSLQCSCFDSSGPNMENVA